MKAFASSLVVGLLVLAGCGEESPLVAAPSEMVAEKPEGPAHPIATALDLGRRLEAGKKDDAAIRQQETLLADNDCEAVFHGTLATRFERGALYAVRSMFAAGAAKGDPAILTVDADRLCVAVEDPIAGGPVALVGGVLGAARTFELGRFAGSDHGGAGHIVYDFARGFLLGRPAVAQVFDDIQRCTETADPDIHPIALETHCAEMVSLELARNVLAPSEDLAVLTSHALTVGRIDVREVAQAEDLALVALRHDLGAYLETMKEDLPASMRARFDGGTVDLDLPDPATPGARRAYTVTRKGSPPIQGTLP